MMTDSSKNLTVWVDTTGKRPVRIGCRDREVAHTRIVLAHLTEEDALKICDYIKEELKKPDTPKIIIDSISEHDANFLQAGRTIYIGEMYRHFKGTVYQVLGFAKHTETGETLVIYQDQNNKNNIMARPFDMFASEIDHAKYPDVKQKYRFEQITGDTSYQDQEKELEGTNGNCISTS